MFQGNVKFFNQEKGFGFIKYFDEAGSEREIFVHITAVENQQPLNENDAVSFEIGEGKKGPMAVNVAVTGAGVASDEVEETEEDMDMAA